MSEIPLKDKIDTIYNALEANGGNLAPVKTKKLKLPRRAKVRKGKIKKGWVGVLRVDENGNLSGEKQKIEDSAFNTKDGTYHATDGSEILFWEGKFPILIQPTKALNPLKVNGIANQTYGQKYIMAKMLKDAIKIKSKGGSFIIWIIVIIALFLGAKYIFKF